MATINPDAQLNVHVFGASQGESLILELPDAKWGVIDCFASALSDPAANPTYKFLESRKVKELEFLCLTHPHDDHFRGMSQLLESFSVRYFWRPSAMSGERLKWLLQLSWRDALRSGDSTATDDATELERIFTLVKESRRERKAPLIPKNATVGTQLYPVPVDTSAALQIWCIAPSGTQTDNYEDDLKKCFDTSGHLIASLPHARHNEISLALLVIYGKTRIILGGDVEKNGWISSRGEFGEERLAADFVKISHHGSTTGYCDGLWEIFSKSGKPIAALTPFQRHRLPRKEALTHIRDYVQCVLTPCLFAISTTELPIPLSSKAPAGSRQALARTFNARSSVSVTPGRCSFTFDNLGNCVRQHVDASAGEVPLS
jgi:hypothetical protein